MKLDRISILIMAGGLGKRFGDPGKIFTRVCGEPVIERVLRVVSLFGEIYIAVSPYTKSYSQDLCKRYKCIETPGSGYPWDLSIALSKLEKPVLVLPADLPFITHDSIESFLSRALEIREPVVTLRVCRDDFCDPIGVSLIRGKGGSWANIDYNYSEEFIDIDTKEDLQRAEELCDSMADR
ncbi:MAG: NTP transferase domain-containing protein [Desulfurococcales archaeon]|jgi:adenosylcobinamide-phosphate guanylyltransferase|nr:NTP transferase domain-containing protein [Desulfurococcales archaeon]